MNMVSFFFRFFYVALYSNWSFICHGTGLQAVDAQHASSKLTAKLWKRRDLQEPVLTF